MSVGDAELLALTRSGVRPPAAVWAVVAAMRPPSSSGGTISVEGLMEHTGYDRATVYRARDWLDTNAPAWRDPPAVVAVVATNGHGTVEVVATAAIVPPATNGARCLTWRDTLAIHRAAVNGSKTWDLYADIYSKAADDLFAAGGINDLIGLTVDYVETIIGGKVTAGERKRIAQVTRMHGKAVLYGLHEALARVDSPTAGPAITYAVSVARTAHRNIRAKQQGAPA